MAKQPRQQRIDVYGGFTPTGVDRTAGDKMRALAGLGQTMEEATLAIGKPIIEAKRAEEGAQAVKDGAGKIDPQTGEVLETPEIAAYKFGASQYKQAAQQALAIKGQKASNAYLTSLNTEIRDTVENAAVEHAEDPVAFEAAIKVYKESTLATINDAEIEARVNDSIAGRALGHQLKIQEQYNIAEDKRNTNSHLAGLEGSVKSVLQMVNSGVGQDLIAAERQTAINEMEALQLIDPTYDVEGKTKALDQAIYDQTVSTEILNLATSSKNMPEAYAKLQEYSTKVPSDRTPSEWSAFIDSQQQNLNQVSNRFKNAQAVATKEEQKFVSGVIDLVSMGQTVDPTEMDRAKEIAQGNPNLTTAIERAESVSVFASSDYQVRAGAIDEACNGSAATGSLCRLLTETDLAVQTALAKDSMGFAISQGYAENIEMDVLSPTPEQIAQRKTAANEASMHYYGRPGMIPILTDAEGDYFVKQFSEMTTDEQMVSIKTYGADSYIWGMFSEKNAGVYAQAAGNPNNFVTEAILNGVVELKNNNFSFDRTSTSLSENEFNRIVGADTYDADDFKHVYDAAIAYYVSQRPRQKNETLDVRDWEDAVQAVTGGIEEVRGFPTVMPANLDSNEVVSYFENMSVSEFERIVPGLPNDVAAVALESLRDNMRIRAVKGENLYIAQYVTNDGTTDDYLTLFQADNITPVYFELTPEIVNSAVQINGTTEDEQAEAKIQQRAEEFAEEIEEIVRLGITEVDPITKQVTTFGDQGAIIDQDFVPEMSLEDYMASQIEGGEEENDQGMIRQDGSGKSSQGYLGQVTRDDGGIMTEYSIGVEINGVETEIPSLVPTLTKKEIETLRTLPEGSEVPKEIQIKAADYAKKRMSEGKSPFFQDEEVEGKNADGTSFLYKG